MSSHEKSGPIARYACAGSLRRSACAIATGVALVIGGVAQSASAQDNASEHLEERKIRLNDSEILKKVDPMWCPTGMHLTDQRYGETRWNLQRGVEILQSRHNVLFDVDIWSQFSNRTQGIYGTVSNWFGSAQTVTIVLHCVR